MEEEEKDVYDTMLTQAELQNGVETINTAVNKEAADARRNGHTTARRCIHV